MTSVFNEKGKTPTLNDLKKVLGNTFAIWQTFTDFTKTAYPKAIAEWNYSSPKFGWSFRIKDSKRVIVYLLPRDNFFKVALVFGQKATDVILKSAISENIKNDLEKAKVYAEGRGVRIDIIDKSLVEDIKTLIAIKISN